jgi:hypothetical protein
MRVVSLFKRVLGNRKKAEVDPLKKALADIRELESEILRLRANEITRASCCWNNEKEVVRLREEIQKFEELNRAIGRSYHGR